MLVTASTALWSGLFYRTTADQPAAPPAFDVTVNPLRRRGDLWDADFIRDWVSLAPPAAATPYAGIRRLPPGSTLVWRPGADRWELHEWLGPDTVDAPSLGEQDGMREYDRAFARALDACEVFAQPYAARLSGGLDSTFAVASLLLHGQGGAAVRAYTSAPAHSAPLALREGWEPDETHLVRALAAVYPRLTVDVIRNDRRVPPLDAARETSRANGWPVYTVANQWWLRRIDTAAAESGTDIVISGSRGNLSFSHNHDYALPEAVARKDVAAAIRCLARSAPADSATRSLRSYEVVRQLSRLTRTMIQPGSGIDPAWRKQYRLLIGLPADSFPSSEQTPVGRAAFLNSLFGRHASWGAAEMPRTETGLMTYDPFATRPVLEVAAAIKPFAWRRSWADRGFARHLAAGRVPPEIRLRRKRGMQSPDTWWTMTGLQQQYLEYVEQLEDTPVLAGWVDSGTVRRLVADWPWGRPGGPPEVQVMAVNRLLALAQFIRDVDAARSAGVRTADHQAPPNAERPLFSDVL